MESINKFISEKIIETKLKEYLSKYYRINKDNFSELILEIGDNIIRLYRALEMKNNSSDKLLVLHMDDSVNFLTGDEKDLYNEFIQKHWVEISKLPYDDNISLEFYEFYQYVNSNLYIREDYTAERKKVDDFILSEINKALQKSDISNINNKVEFEKSDHYKTYYFNKFVMDILNND